MFKVNFDRLSEYEDPHYLDLIRMACDTHNYLEPPQAIQVLNSISKHKNRVYRLFPILYAASKSLNIFEKLDQEVQDLLKNETRKGVITELAKQAQLSHIVTLFTECEIPMILLKGSAFNCDIYSRNIPRLSNDIDLLVRSQDWDTAVKLLNRNMIYSRKQNEGVLEDIYEISFKPKGTVGAAVDLHKGLILPYLFDICEEELWESSTVHPRYKDDNVRMLSPEHALLHQAIHAYKDMDFRKYNLVDTHNIISHLPVNRSALIECAHRWGVDTCLYYLFLNLNQVVKPGYCRAFIRGLQPSKLTRGLLVCVVYGNEKNLACRDSIFFRLKQFFLNVLFTQSIVNPVKLNLLYLQTFFRRERIGK